MTYWFYMLLSNEGHIRVATLRNHLLQNNVISSNFIAEEHKHPQDRLSVKGRAFRLLLYLMGMLIMAAELAMLEYQRIEGEVKPRQVCSTRCQTAHFPRKICSLDELIQNRGYQEQGIVPAIVYEGHLYQNLFLYADPARDLNLMPNASNVISDQEKIDFWKCRQYVDRNARVKYKDGAKTYYEKTQVCFPHCKRVIDMKDPDIARDNRPECMCSIIIDPPILSTSTTTTTTVVNGTSLLATTREPIYYEVCRHTEFGKGNCTEPCNLFDDMICVHPTVPVDDPYFPLQVCWESGGVSYCVSFVQILLTVIFANLQQLILELFYTEMALLDENNSFEEATTKCCSQLLFIVLMLIWMLLVIGTFKVAERCVKSSAIWVTWGFAILLDQAKSLLIAQPFIYYVVIRRCGWLPPGIQFYNEYYINQWPIESSTFEITQFAVGRFVIRHEDHSAFLLKFYSVFVFLGLVISDEIRKDLLKGAARPFAEVYYWSDVVMTTIMLIEVILKVYWKGLAFFELFECFDTFIIVAAFIALCMTGPHSEGVAGLGLLRLMRLVKVIIRSQPKRKQIEKVKDSKDEFTVGSNVDRVLELCDKLLKMQGISDEQYANMCWVQDCISKNELYAVSMDADQGLVADPNMAAWVQDLNFGGDLHIDTNTRREKLDEGGGGNGGRGGMVSTMGGGGQDRAGFGQSMMKAGRESSVTGGGAGARSSKANQSTMNRGGSQMNRGGSRIGGGSRMGSRARGNMHSTAGGGGGEDSMETMLKGLMIRLGLSVQDEANLQPYLKNYFVEWQYDSFNIYEMLDPNCLSMLMLKVFLVYQTIRALSLNFDLLYSYLNSVERNFNPDVRFHNAIHAVDMVQTICVFLDKFPTNYAIIGDMDLFVTMIATLVIHEGHPGLTEEFLIKCRHPRAVRYNDRHILQSYNLARAFANIQDPEMNFFIHAEKDLFEYFRKLLIKIVMRLDFKRFFSEMTLLQTKIVNAEFPADDEDRYIIMSNLIRLADVSWTMRNTNYFFRWVDKFNDEFFAQGDLERDLGLDISPVCDRDFVDTSKVNVAYMVVIVTPFARVYNAFLGPNKFFKKDVLEDGLEANRNCLQSWIS